MRRFISFHIERSEIFHNFRKKIISHSVSPNISLERIVDLCYNVYEEGDVIKGHHSLVNQLERSATSIGANIHEANYAHGKADFVAKLQIALKECYETEYWIELFVKSELIEREMAKELYNQCPTIRRILIASINTQRRISNEKNIQYFLYYTPMHMGNNSNLAWICSIFGKYKP